MFWNSLQMWRSMERIQKPINRMFESCFVLHVQNRIELILSKKLLQLRSSEITKNTYISNVFQTISWYRKFVLTEYKSVQSNVNKPQVATGYRCCICRDNWANYSKKQITKMNYTTIFSDRKVLESYRCSHISVIVAIDYVMQYFGSFFTLSNKYSEIFIYLQITCYQFFWVFTSFAIELPA